MIYGHHMVYIMVIGYPNVMQSNLPLISCSTELLVRAIVYWAHDYFFYCKTRHNNNRHSLILI